MTMPLPSMPADDVLISLGRMVLQFAELEYWVNIGIVEAEHTADAAKQAETRRRPFSERVDRLGKALAAAEKKGWAEFGKDGVPAVDFVPTLKEVAEERNDLLHGATFVFVSTVTMSYSGHRKFNPRWDKKTGKVDVRVRELDKATLDNLAERVRGYAERLQYVVLDLCLGKQASGIGSLNWG